MRKRFVSGAVCPACGLEDKIYVVGEGLDTLRRCNQCGFEERLGNTVTPGEAVINIQPPK